MAESLVTRGSVPSTMEEFHAFPLRWLKVPKQTRLSQFLYDFPTVGEFLAANEAEVLRCPNIGVVSFQRVEAAIEAIRPKNVATKEPEEQSFIDWCLANRRLVEPLMRLNKSNSLG